jgi:hypothetical protein
MIASDFCLALSGDTASSRRISEIIVSGCIPVFVGPPWHSRPLQKHIPWDKIALFFEIRNAFRWPAGYNANVLAGFDPRLIQELSGDENATKYVVDGPLEVLRILEMYSRSTIAKLRSRVIAHRSIMMYGGHEPGQASFGTLAIMDDICAYGKKLYVRDAWQDEKMRLSGGHLLTPTA